MRLRVSPTRPGTDLWLWSYRLRVAPTRASTGLWIWSYRLREFHAMGTDLLRGSHVCHGCSSTDQWLWSYQDGWSALVCGIGGTGVVTVGSVLGQVPASYCPTLLLGRFSVLHGTSLLLASIRTGRYGTTADRPTRPYSSPSVPPYELPAKYACHSTRVGSCT